MGFVVPQAENGYSKGMGRPRVANGVTNGVGNGDDHGGGGRGAGGVGVSGVADDLEREERSRMMMG